MYLVVKLSGHFTFPAHELCDQHSHRQKSDRPSHPQNVNDQRPELSRGWDCNENTPEATARWANQPGRSPAAAIAD